MQIGEKNPTVSVIIPTYNRSKMLFRAIQSVLNQTYQDYEVIVVDDGSTDNTEKVIRDLQEKDDRIRYVKHEKNKGGAAARNTGIREASVKYIAFLDSDDEWVPEKLQKQINLIEHSSKQTGVVYSYYKSYYLDGTTRIWTPKLTNFEEVKNQILSEREIMPDPQAVMIKRECFNKVGCLDEDFPVMHFAGFWIRLCEHYEFACLPEVHALLYQQEDSISGNPEDYAVVHKKLLNRYKDFFLKYNINKYALRLYNTGRKLIRVDRYKEGMKCIGKSIKLKPKNLRYRISFLMGELGIKRFKYFI